MLTINKYKLVREKVASYNVNTIVQSPKDIYRFFTSGRNGINLQELIEEEMYIVSLNCKSKITSVHMVSHGSDTASIVEPKAIFQRALLDQASSIILIHNHPSGDPRPSKNDKMITKRLIECGELLNIQVMDHVIIGDDYFSFREAGLML